MSSVENLPLRSVLMICFAVAACIPLGACGLDQKGMVLFTDPSFSASVMGTSKDGFDAPDGIMWKAGRLYMADEGGSAFRIWDDSEHVATLSDRSAGVKSPEDIAVDNDGSIYFTDDDAGGVWKIDISGRTKHIVGSQSEMTSTEGIALAPNGDLLVGDGEVHEIFSITPSGTISVYLGKEYGIRKPESMAFDGKGGLYIADNDENVLYFLTPDKTLHRVIDDRDGFAPETLCLAKGILYITDSRDGKLFTYTPLDGLRTLATFAGELKNVNGVTTDDTGIIYVTVQTSLKEKKAYLLKIQHAE